jgi:hypothetical protein
MFPGDDPRALSRLQKTQALMVKLLVSGGSGAGLREPLAVGLAIERHEPERADVYRDPFNAALRHDEVSIATMASPVSVGFPADSHIAIWVQVMA